MKLLSINGKDLVRGIKAGCINLEHHRDEVDMLNVFPVPDGDTGTNMYLTILSAVQEGEKVAQVSIKAVTKKISMGALMGARGNSGVIVSQVFRGMAKHLEQKETANALDIALALKSGAQTAYEAVMKPVEGTILTVVREVAKAGEMCARKDDDIIHTLVAGLKAGYSTLEKTPQMLPVLREAGVVDAGGQGFLLFLEGMIKGLSQEQDSGEDFQLTPLLKTLTFSNKEPISLDFQYCTELLIQGHNLDANDIKDHLQPLGDSMLVVGEPELIKVHIHSNHPGKVLETCLQWGNLLDIKINNMLEEVHEHIQNWKNQEAKETQATPDKKLGVVAVSMGEGLTDILTSLGVDVIIPGGQTMNPSTEDLLNACKQIHADHVLILPNNSNIIMAAEQVAQLMPGKIEVIPTKSVVQGISAMVAFEPEEDVADVKANMLEAIANTYWAEVTYAVRDTRMNGLSIQSGDIIGLIEGNIAVQGNSPEEVVEELLHKMVIEDVQLINLFYGEDVDEEQAQQLQKKTQQLFPECEVELAYGGQPYYRYLLLVE